MGSFPTCWRQTSVTSIPKGPSSSFVVNYRPSSITSVLSKVFERLVSVRLGRFMERSGVLPTTQFAYWKGLGTPDALLCVFHILQSALERGQEASILQIGFSAAFDRVNHRVIIYKLRSVGIGGSVLSILTVSIKSITARYGGVVSMNWLTSCRECRRAVFWVRYCSYCSCTLRTFFSILENKLIGYDEDFTLAVVTSPGVRVL